jgi:hypothetical protein
MLTRQPSTATTRQQLGRDCTRHTARARSAGHATTPEHAQHTTQQPHAMRSRGAHVGNLGHAAPRPSRAPGLPQATKLVHACRRARDRSTFTCSANSGHWGAVPAACTHGAAACTRKQPRRRGNAVAQHCCNQRRAHDQHRCQCHDSGACCLPALPAGSRARLLCVLSRTDRAHNSTKAVVTRVHSTDVQQHRPFSSHAGKHGTRGRGGITAQPSTAQRHTTAQQPPPNTLSSRHCMAPDTRAWPQPPSDEASPLTAWPCRSPQSTAFNYWPWKLAARKLACAHCCHL